MIKVAVVIPYVRKDNILGLMEEIYQNAGIPKTDFTIIAEEDTEGIGCPKMVKRLVDKSESEMVAFLGDDTAPAKGFLKSAIMQMEMFEGGWGLVGLGDGTCRMLPTHWLAHRKLLPHLDGEFFHTGYYHCYCDNELWARSLEIKRAVMVHRPLVLHRHPAFGTAPMDKHYKRVYSKEYLEHDKALHEKRKNNNWKGVL
jgi:hypothetical protein